MPCCTYTYVCMYTICCKICRYVCMYIVIAECFVICLVRRGRKCCEQTSNHKNVRVFDASGVEVLCSF